MSSKKIHTRQIVKKPFILLELLIAFALVGISIVPFIRFPLHQIKKETDFLSHMELERRANNILCKMTEKLIRKEVPQEPLFQIKKKIIDSELQELKIAFADDLKRTYSFHSYYECEKVKIDREGNQVAQVFLTVKFYNNKKEKVTIDTDVFLEASQKFVVVRKPNILLLEYKLKTSL